MASAMEGVHFAPERFRTHNDHYRGTTRMRVLLLLPFIGLLWLPFYNSELPALLGFPFFYWYQLLWVPLTALLIWIVYRHEYESGEA